MTGRARHLECRNKSRSLPEVAQDNGDEMSLAAIMVHVDFETSRDRIDAAADLAVRFNARLIGIAGWPLRVDYPAGDGDFNFKPASEALREIKLQFDRLGEQFRQAAGANPRGVEWRTSPHFPSEVIADAARVADLVVIGQDPLPGDLYRTFDPGTVILAAGRPILVLPPGMRHVAASRILIAWKNTREARRAIRDAMPLLKAAQSVHIASVAPQELEERVEEQIGDIANYLAHHHVVMGGRILSTAHEAEGPALLDLAKRQNADLIVAGAYGRTRLSEWVFGGVTRHLLMKATIPCLLTH